MILVVVVGAQVACSTPSITMWHPINQKVVRCVDEPCAAQYEAAGYTRVSDAQKKVLGLK